MKIWEGFEYVQEEKLEKLGQVYIFENTDNITAQINDLINFENCLYKIIAFYRMPTHKNPIIGFICKKIEN
jgi:hypothetical protein